MPQGPTGGTGVVGNLLLQLGLLWLGIANDGLDSAWVALSHRARSTA
jgi:hypothetical protein